jgi:hypothetical protein
LGAGAGQPAELLQMINDEFAAQLFEEHFRLLECSSRDEHSAHRYSKVKRFDIDHQFSSF